MGLLQWTATLLGSSARRDSFRAPPPCWGALGSGTPSGHCHIDGEQWAVGFLQCTLMGSNGQWDSFSVLPHWGQWVEGLLQHTTTLLGSTGQWISFSILPRCWRAVGSGTPSVYRHTAREQWAVDPLQYTASLLGTTGQRISFDTILLGSRGQGDLFCTPPHRCGAMGSGTPSILRRHWAVDLLLLTATLPGSCGQWMVAPKRSRITGRGGAKCPTVPVVATFMASEGGGSPQKGAGSRARETDSPTVSVVAGLCV